MLQNWIILVDSEVMYVRFNQNYLVIKFIFDPCIELTSNTRLHSWPIHSARLIAVFISKFVRVVMLESRQS